MIANAMEEERDGVRRNRGKRGDELGFLGFLFG